jgi:hypothetical protein
MRLTLSTGYTNMQKEVRRKPKGCVEIRRHYADTLKHGIRVNCYRFWGEVQWPASNRLNY